MKTFTQRRKWAMTISFLAALIVIVAVLSYSLVLHDIAHVTGWTLLAVMLFLTFFHARKKLTYPPLLNAATWLQVHIYVGALSLLIFFLHIQWRTPNGWFETIFYILFISLAGSGLLGIYFTRTIPKALSTRGGEVIFERIPQFVKQLREQAEALVVESVRINNSTILADYYQTNLATYLAAPRRFGTHAFVVDRTRDEYQRQLKALHRYLNDAECEVAERLSDVLATKDDLDFHYARQGILKGWLFLHIPLTYAVLLFTAAHVLLVHAFSLGLP